MQAAEGPATAAPNADLRVVLDEFQRSEARDLAGRGRLRALQSTYALSNFKPLWGRDARPTPQAIALLRTLRSAEGYGLRTQYYMDVLGADQASVSTPGNDFHGLIGPRLEFALSAAALQFLTDVHFGRVDPAAAGFHLEDTRPPLDLPALLQQLATTSDMSAVVATIEPQFYHYQLLKMALSRYRQLASGTVSPSPVEQGTAPYDQRIRQIELTLERWRWLPAFTSPPIIVNIPQFRLFAFESTRDRKSEIIQMDVIVGRTYPRLQTPIFTADLKYVIFRPYWDVPYSITQREMLPAIRANPDDSCANTVCDRTGDRGRLGVVLR